MNKRTKIPKAKMSTLLFTFTPVICLFISGFCAFFVQNINVRFWGLLFVEISFLAVIYLIVLGIKFPIPAWKGRLPKSFLGYMMATLLVFMSLFMAKSTINQILDIPYVVTSNYAQTEGKLQSFAISTRGTRTIKLNNINFNLDMRNRDYYQLDNVYIIEYLPNSKFVIDIYRKDQ